MASDYKRMLVTSPILGIIQNTPADTIDPRAFVTAHNVVFRNGQVEKVKGWKQSERSAVGSVNFIEIGKYDSVSLSSLVGTNQNLYNYLPSALTQLNPTPFLCMKGNRWDSDYLFEQWFFSNLQDGLWAWNGQGQAYPYTNAAAYKAQCMAQFQNHILLGNIMSPNDPTGPWTIAGSSLLTGGQVLWDLENPNSDSIVFEVPEEASPIQALKRSNSQLIVYKEKSIFTLAYVGGGFEYNKQQVITNIGLKSRASLVDFGDKHVYLGTDNLYSFNGSNNQSFGDRIWQWLQSDAAINSTAQIWAFLDRRFKEVIFTYITTGATTFTKALVWNYQYDAFSTRDFPFTACGYFLDPVNSGSISSLQQAIDTYGVLGGSKLGILAGDSLGQLWKLDETTDLAGTNPLVAILETGDTCFGAPERYKVVGGMDIEQVGMTGSPLQVYVAARKSLADPLVWAGPYSLPANSGWRGVNFMSQNVWYRFRFVKPDGAMVLRGYAPRFQVRGWY